MHNTIKCKWGWGGARPPLKQHLAQSAAKGGELSGVLSWRYRRQHKAIRQAGLFVYGRSTGIRLSLRAVRTNKSPAWGYIWRHCFDENTPIQQRLQRGKRSIHLQTNGNESKLICNHNHDRSIVDCDVNCTSVANGKRHRRICFGGNDCSHQVAFREAVSLCG